MMSKTRERVLTAIVAVVVLGVIAAILFPVFAQTKNGRSIGCISTMRQIGTATLMYLADFDEKLPARSWWDPVYPYAKNWDLFECDKVRAEGKRYGHAMNVRALGRDATKVDLPEKFIVYFDTDALGRDVIANLAARSPARYGKGSVVVRLDSSAKFIPYTQEPYDE